MWDPRPKNGKRELNALFLADGGSTLFKEKNSIVPYLIATSSKSNRMYKKIKKQITKQPQYIYKQ